MTSERASAPRGDDEDDTALEYYDDEDELEAFSDAEQGCEDGGRRIYVLLRKVTYRQRERGRAALLYFGCETPQRNVTLLP